jgi:hypothetical protein
VAGADGARHNHAALAEQAPPPPDVAENIARCAAAMSDLPRLRHEVQYLRESDDPYAKFATALFDLDRARRGDAEARATMLEVADALLIYWREGTGEQLAQVNPVLEDLWAAASSLLISFELKRFERALKDCWNARGDAATLAVALEALLPEGNRRVEFARCLYHLELARLFVDSSRAEFARRVSLLSEAYKDEAVAAQLVGTDPGLKTLWEDVVPYLDEFFEHLEEQAARRDRASRPEAKTDPSLDAPPQPSPEPRRVPSFKSLVGDQQPPLALETPPGLTQRRTDPAIEPVDDEEVIEGIPLPPAPPRTSSDEFELVDIVETSVAPPPPPPPSLTPARGLAAALAQTEDDDEGPPPDPATLDFWAHTFESLELLPAGEEGRGARLLAIETRAERKRLNTYLDTLGPFMDVHEARAMSCLIRLMLAGQTKEKSLFGQPNPRRAEALAGALNYLETTPAAAGHAAVWFELDGKVTQAALGRGLELAWQYLSYCAHVHKDPLNPDTVAAFTNT